MTKNKEDKKDEVEETEEIEETETESETESEEETSEDESEEDSGKKSSSQPVDYKAIAEQERLAREKAESLIAGYKFRKKKGKKAEQDDDSDSDEDDESVVPLSQVKKIVDESLSRSNNIALKERIEQISRDLASSPEEAEAIREIYANRRFPDNLTLTEQLEEAHAILNRKVNTSKMKELGRAAQSKKTISTEKDSGQRDAQAASAPKMSPEDKNAYESAGFTFNSKLRIFQKKLPNGKFLNKDPKTKRSWVA